MSNVIIVSAVFPPEPVVSAKTSFELANELRQIGHKVTVIAPFPNRPAGELFAGYSRKLYKLDKLDNGVDIIHCFATLSPESGIFSRFLENLSFGVTSGWIVLFANRPHVVYANTWPILATGILSLVAKLRHIPLVISVQDVYPETLVVQDRINPRGFVARLMCWIDSLIAQNSAHVIVISKRFADIYRYQRRVLPNRLSLIPNWINGNQIDISVSREQYRERKCISENDFLLVYGGNVGVAAGVETIIEAMRLLVEEPHVRLLVAGAGSQLAACKCLAQTFPEQTVLFHSPWAAEETSELLRAADILVLPTQREQSLVSMPSKLITYMLAGRPVIAQAMPGSDLAQTIEDADCGWVVLPEDPDMLAAAIRKVMAIPYEERNRRGLSGRDYALRHFTQATCLPKVINLLEQTANLGEQ